MISGSLGVVRYREMSNRVMSTGSSAAQAAAGTRATATQAKSKLPDQYLPSRSQRAYPRAFTVKTLLLSVADFCAGVFAETRARTLSRFLRWIRRRDNFEALTVIVLR